MHDQWFSGHDRSAVRIACRQISVEAQRLNSPLADIDPEIYGVKNLGRWHCPEVMSEHKAVSDF